MMKHSKHYALPVLVGGVIASVLCLIPCVSLGCCLYVAVAGAAAVAMIQKKENDVIEMGEGAVIGALTGVVVSAITWGISAILNLVLHVGVGSAYGNLARTGALPPDVAEAMASPAIGLAIGCCFNLLLYGISGTVGGVIGSAVFKPKQPPPGGGGVAMTPAQGAQGPGGWGQPVGGQPQGGGYPPAGGGQPGGGQQGGWPQQGGGQQGGWPQQGGGQQGGGQQGGGQQGGGGQSW